LYFLYIWNPLQRTYNILVFFNAVFFIFYTFTTMFENKGIHNYFACVYIFQSNIYVFYSYIDYHLRIKVFIILLRLFIFFNQVFISTTHLLIISNYYRTQVFIILLLIFISINLVFTSSALLLITVWELRFSFAIRYLYLLKQFWQQFRDHATNNFGKYSLLPCTPQRTRWR
jgi:hypothetical protein